MLQLKGLGMTKNWSYLLATWNLDLPVCDSTVSIYATACPKVNAVLKYLGTMQWRRGGVEIDLPLSSRRHWMDVSGQLHVPVALFQVDIWQEVEWATDSAQTLWRR
jgi:hypothetical protein